MRAVTAFRRYRCDGSAWEFSVYQEGRELVAQLYFRGEAYGPEFRAADQAVLQASIARYLLLHAERAGGLANVGELH
ncbi:hypothetical protein ASE10_13485 [Lysobacter sp. Root76]|nr:hypothetical protein ASE10_13485 [Lysobacter sp. Root76]